MKTLAYPITASVLLLAVSPALAQLAPADPAPAPAPGPTPLAPVPAAPLDAPLDAPPPAAVTEPQPAWAAPAPAQAVAPVSTAVEPEGEEELAPDRVTVGKNGGFWQPGLLLQAWGLVRHLDNDDADVADTQTWFRIRRAELKMKGEIVPELVAYQVMIDPAKTIFRSATVPVTPPTDAEPSPGSVSVRQPGNDASILQDVYITFLSEYADVSIGEFKIPVSLEGYGSSSRLILPERALVSTTFGDRRDMGLRIEKKIGKTFYYYAGLFSGSGINQVDEDNEKEASLRVEVYPVEGLTLGAVGYATLGERDGSVRDRVEVDARYDAHNVLLQAEYIRGWDGEEEEGQRREGHGSYVAAGYTFLERIQPVLRVGFVDPNLDEDDDRTTHYDAGLNYYLRGQEARLTLSVSVFDQQAADAPSTIDGILAAQVSF